MRINGFDCRNNPIIILPAPIKDLEALLKRYPYAACTNPGCGFDDRENSVRL